MPFEQRRNQGPLCVLFSVLFKVGFVDHIISLIIRVISNFERIVLLWKYSSLQ